MGKQISQNGPSAAMIDQVERSGSVKGLLLLALGLVLVAASLVFLKGQFGGQLQLIFLSVLAGVVPYWGWPLGCCVLGVLPLRLI